LYCRDPTKQEQQDALFQELRERLKKAEQLLQVSSGHNHNDDEYAVGQCKIIFNICVISYYLRLIFFSDNSAIIFA
jgi:hypothetical protein